MAGAPMGSEGARREHLGFEDHLLNISRKDVSADVPMGLNVGAVASPDRVGHHFRD